MILILITDSDDASPRLTAPQFWSRLLELKGGDRRKVTAVGVVSPSHRSCPKDQGAPQGPVQIEKLIALSDGLELDLCSHNFGQELARIGSDLSVRVSRIVIPLAGLPDFNPKQKFEVTYMDEPIERADASHPSRGWSYDPDTQSIIIEPKTELKETAEPRLAVNYTPILAGNATIGKVKNRKPAESK